MDFGWLYVYCVCVYVCVSVLCYTLQYIITLLCSHSYYNSFFLFFFWVVEAVLIFVCRLCGAATTVSLLVENVVGSHNNFFSCFVPFVVTVPRVWLPLHDTMNRVHTTVGAQHSSNSLSFLATIFLPPAIFFADNTFYCLTASLVHSLCVVRMFLSCAQSF